MDLIVEIPGDIAGHSREAFLADEYRHERLSKPELQQLLGIETSYALDGFLKAHGV